MLTFFLTKYYRSFLIYNLLSKQKLIQYKIENKKKSDNFVMSKNYY